MDEPRMDDVLDLRGARRCIKIAWRDDGSAGFAHQAVGAHNLPCSINCSPLRNAAGASTSTQSRPVMSNDRALPHPASPFIPPAQLSLPPPKPPTRPSHIPGAHNKTRE